MPELPEVETVCRDLRPVLTGALILGADNRWPNCLRGEISLFPDLLTGRRILSVNRRAKYLVLELEADPRGGLWLLIHLKMSGRLWLRPAEEITPRPAFPAGTGKTPGHKPQSENQNLFSGNWPAHVHTAFLLEDKGFLLFHDPRKFGRVYLTRDPAEVFDKLGPEPLSDDFRSRDLESIVRSSRTVLKGLLLNQQKIAGLGNIYADEACFRAGLRPARRTGSLDNEEIKKLYRCLRSALRHGIKRRGANLGDGVYHYSGGQFQNDFFVYGRAGKPCRRCRTPIQKIRLCQRGTHFCPNCQS